MKEISVVGYFYITLDSLDGVVTKVVDLISKNKIENIEEFVDEELKEIVEFGFFEYTSETNFTFYPYHSIISIDFVLKENEDEN